MHVPARTLAPRSSSGGAGGLSTDTIIIISVVCGCVVILAFTLFLWRLLARCFKPARSNPLPPVQDLAHRREQQLAAFTASRQSQWLDPSGSALTAHASFQTGSSVSLLPNQEKNASTYTDDGTTAESSMHSPVTMEMDPALQPPNPMFYPPATSATSSPHISMISTDSSYSTLPRTGVSPSPSKQPSEAEAFSTSQLSVEGGVVPQVYPRPQTRTPSRSNMRSLSRGRPQSQISVGTSYSGHTMRSSSVRGAPHKPYSGVQIVLPAPLASDVPTHQRVSTYELPSRNSMFVDQWVAVGSRPVTAEEPGRPRKSSSTSSRRSQRSASTPPSQRDSQPLPPLPTGEPRRMPSASSGVSKRQMASQHSRSASSLRHELSKDPYASVPPAQTYSNLANLAESSFEINDIMRDRGRAHVGLDSVDVTPSSSFQSTAVSAPSTPQTRSRSQSRSKLQRNPAR
ncbi:hypothetical protein BDW22DRAFT_1427557 [Trametopsis cervina]|nr:hypothetical protein BDW22DRAFT_1427557 [Trametopsis cervina]